MTRWLPAALALLAPAYAQAQVNAEAVSVDAPATAVAGGTLAFEAIVRIDPGTNVTLTPYLTSGGVFDGAVALPPIPVPQPPIGRTLRVQGAVTVPTNVSGVFTLGVSLDDADSLVETNELDNRAFADTVTRVRPRRPDPVVISLAASSARARPSDPVAVDVTVQNTGELPATVDVSLHLSRDPQISSLDPALGSQSVTVGAGATVVEAVAGVVPADLPAGAYVLGAVVDPTGAVEEVSEANNTAAAPGSFTVYFDDLVFETATLPAATLTIGYHVALEASGGDGAYVWTVSQGALPNGLTLTSGGVLSGVPSRSGDFDFTIQVASDGKTDAREFTIAVERTNAPVTIATREALPGFLNMPYEQGLVAGGGEAPYTWDLVPDGGALPPGLDLTPAGVISGVPNTLGVFNFEVEVEDFLGGRDRAQLRIEVTSATNVIVLTNALDPLPVGEEVSVQLAATGGVSPYVWVALSPAPPGMRLTEDGRLLGTPTRVGRWPVFVRVTDGSRGQVSDSATIQVDVVDAGDFTIEQLVLPNAEIRIPYEVILTASGGEPPLRWSLAAGSALPQDFYLVDGDGEAAPENSGLLYGFAVIDGVHAFTVRVEDAFGRRREMTYALTVEQPLLDLEGGCRAVPPSTAGLGLLLCGVFLVGRRRRRDRLHG